MQKWLVKSLFFFKPLCRGHFSRVLIWLTIAWTIFTGTAQITLGFSEQVKGKGLRLVAVGQALIDYDLRQYDDAAIKQASIYLKGGDIVFTNLENAIVDPHNIKQLLGENPIHGAPPPVLDCLKSMGFNTLALSSNHAWDQGVEGISRTRVEAQQRGFAISGIGKNLEEASSPGYLDTPAGSVALDSMASGSSQLTPDKYAKTNQPGVNMLGITPEGNTNQEDGQRILETIRKAAVRAAYVVVYHHCHIQTKDGQSSPEWMKKWSRQCIDAGGSIYVAHGIPRLFGVEIYKDKPIFYGPANYIFQTRYQVGYYPPEAWQTVVADCQFESGKLASIVLRPIILNEAGQPGETFYMTRGVPRLAQGKVAAEILTRLRDLSKPYRTNIVILGDTAEIRVK